MRALGLNIERTWLRVLVAIGWLMLTAILGFVIAGYMIYLALGIKLEAMPLFLVSLIPMLALGVVYSVDSVRQAPEFR